MSGSPPLRALLAEAIGTFALVFAAPLAGAALAAVAYVYVRGDTPEWQLPHEEPPA